MHCLPVYSHRHRVYVVSCHHIVYEDQNTIDIYSSKDTLAYSINKDILEQWSGGGSVGHYGISFEYTKKYMVDILN